MRQLTECPRCGAKDDEEAQTMCKPSGDECPMTCADDFVEALKLLTQINESLEQQAEEYARQEHEREINERRWRNPTDDMLRDAGLE
jgi:hypothetical protein